MRIEEFVNSSDVLVKEHGMTDTITITFPPGLLIGYSWRLVYLHKGYHEICLDEPHICIKLFVALEKEISPSRSRI